MTAASQREIYDGVAEFSTPRDVNPRVTTQKRERIHYSYLAVCTVKYRTSLVPARLPLNREKERGKEETQEAEENESGWSKTGETVRGQAGNI